MNELKLSTCRSQSNTLYHKLSNEPLNDRIVHDGCGDVRLKDVLKTEDLAILWSYNKQKHPSWLDAIMKSPCRSRFVWWDVGWQLVPRPTPLTGYIWNTIEKQATHRAFIEKIERQPSEQLAEEVKKSWYECKIHSNPNSPLLLYQKNKDSTCTLLKLSSLKKLLHPGKLEDFVLVSEGRPIKQPPQRGAIVIDPHLL
jgi:hypothetical protein